MPLQSTRLQELTTKITERTARNRAARVSNQLPLWPERVRGLPNAFARSALFTVGAINHQRSTFKKQKIAAVGGIEILYSGEELRQDDEDVFLQIVHLARRTPIGDYVEFTAHQLLVALGWNRNSRSYARLKDCIDRLSANGVTVQFDNGRSGYSGSLFRKFVWETSQTDGRRWRIWLEKEIISLFGADTYTQIDWEQRLSLGPLAKWLHSFYFTHREPFGYKVETLKKLCGSEAKQLYHFRQRLILALEELKITGFLEDYEIRNDTVTVKRTPRREALPETIN